jgi:cysteine-rich repeat protein
MSRWLLAAVLPLLPACLPPWTEPGSTTGESSGADASSGDSSGDADTSTSTGADADGSQSASQSGSSTASTTDTTGPDTTASAGTDTSGPLPFCGDGVVDPGEECDDGNSDSLDECSLGCARQRIIFASSEEFQPDDLGGLYFADGICKQLAGAAGLPRSETFIAWLSDSKTSAGSRVFFIKGSFARPDGVLIAQNSEQLLSGELDAPINVTEENIMLEGGGAWTGTLPDGQAVPGAEHCGDWTSDSLFAYGHFGSVGAIDGRWTYEPDPELSPIPCVSHEHVYCVQGE